MKSTERERNLARTEWIFWLSCAYPLLWLCMLYGLGIYMWLRLGHWPSYNNPDPKLMDDFVALQRVEIVIASLGLFGWPILMVAAALALASERALRLRRHGWGFLIAAVGVGLTWWQIASDPVGLSNWMMD